MSGHICVASPAQLPVSGGTRRHTFASQTAGPTGPVAQVWPRMNAAPLFA